MRALATVALVLLVTATASCATLFNGSTETIYVRSDEPSTRFFANERELGTGTSAVTTIPKKQLGRTTLRAQKMGCSDRTSPIQTVFDPVSLLGLFMDAGIISILVVDWLATGAVKKAAQSEYVLTPQCAGASLFEPFPVEPPLTFNGPIDR